jgi:hypothetical protein
MTDSKSIEILPCVAFFSEGRFIAGIIALVMQLTIVLWPFASRWAREMNERSGVERLLAELSEAHRIPSDPYGMPAKRFRQMA